MNDLLIKIKKLLSIESKKVKSKWDRVLPVGDYLVDRWEKASDLGFGKNSSIYDSSLVFGNVEVGENTWVGPFTILDGSGDLKIGNNCSISAGVQIYTHDTVDWAISGGKSSSKKSPVTIGSNCYLGPNCIITKGVTIGDGCIIGANSFVNKSIPNNSRAWGTPARVISSHS